MIKKGLGKGLGALIKDDVLTPNNTSIQETDLNKIIEIDINKVQPDKSQPRKHFNDDTLEELALSIKNVGIISPIIVKKKGDFYEIISGERRFRAAKKLKLKKIPIIIKEYDDLVSLEVSLIENIQRENLNPIEEALTYKIFQEKFNLNQEQIAEKVGKNRTTISNAIRLLKLDSRVQNFVIELKLSQGHARALLPIENMDIQFDLAEKIIEEQLSVRQTEDIVKKLLEEKKEEKNTPKEDDILKKQLYLDISKQLNQILGTKVNIKDNKNKGKIEIEYYSQEELDRLFCILKKL
ncbi:ParB/RepB/Spo0J family partition protein [uncultured Tyzzerella sp.]|uniref:ParB/RepB/Spo0J family partition protein n=1 Tax=uncultured Tyzzerella sp. TaxID=2321398 RepID=UPI0029423D7B|nr:ParB/RepB/Spo0J family partition protein [uncultured Tyzzerella sp.]